MSLERWIRTLWWSAPAACALLLAAPSITLPGDDLGLRRFQTPPLGPDLRLGQTFTMTGNGLHAIEIFPVAARDRIAGDVRLELYEMQGGLAALVGVTEVLAEEVVAASPYRFEFATIAGSKDRTYRFDLVAAPAEGVAFWATMGERYEGGRMHANGRDRWADLAFRAYAPAPSIWARFMALWATNPVRAALATAALTAVWLLLGLTLRMLANIPPEPDHTGSPRAA